jgi:hypothetical protein
LETVGTGREVPFGIAPVPVLVNECVPPQVEVETELKQKLYGVFAANPVPLKPTDIPGAPELGASVKLAVVGENAPAVMKFVGSWETSSHAFPVDGTVIVVPDGIPLAEVAMNLEPELHALV